MNPQKTESQMDLAERIAAHKPGRRRIKAVVSVLLILVLGTSAYFVWGPSGSQEEFEARFHTRPLEKGKVGLTITATGNLEPTNEVTVGSEVSGLVVEVFVDSNAVVKKGQKLAQIDRVTFENDLRSAQAALAGSEAAVQEAEASLKQAQRTLARAEALRKKSNGQAPSIATMENAESAIEIAKASLIAKQAAVKQNEALVDIKANELSKTFITSPTDGIVLSRSVDPGQTVAASFSAPELFIIAEDLSSMKLEVSIAEADIGQVAVGQEASFSVDAWPERDFSAAVTKVSYGSEIVDNVVTYETELDVSNDDLSLRPGMTATAEIHVDAKQEVWVVPVQALRFSPTPPEGAAGPGAGGPPPGVAGGKAPESEGSSFLDKMMPRPPRGNSSRKSNAGTNPQSAGSSQIWVLDNGHPRPIEVEVGLSDGTVTEVSSDELEAGMEIILYEEPVKS
ncbi:efflux RND transporter periplasmic adaptor subunit [Kiritimatiellaeota bacterium B1221]|nr:efflux RND transporter periplasmic adaptor subunit [Kiritimatiellaeota bacterium B1221]